MGMGTSYLLEGVRFAEKPCTTSTMLATPIETREEAARQAATPANNASARKDSRAAGLRTVSASHGRPSGRGLHSLNGLVTMGMCMWNDPSANGPPS